MKKLTTLFLVAFSSVMLAQVPNPCFSTWSATPSSPMAWQSSNFIVNGSVQEAFDIYGSCPTSAELNSVDTGHGIYAGIYYGGGLVTWDGHTVYFHNAGNPVALNGWYEF